MLIFISLKRGSEIKRYKGLTSTSTATYFAGGPVTPVATDTIQSYNNHIHG